jgi:hypothetical protein
MFSTCPSTAMYASLEWPPVALNRASWFAVGAAAVARDGAPLEDGREVGVLSVPMMPAMNARTMIVRQPHAAGLVFFLAGVVGVVVAAGVVEACRSRPQCLQTIAAS